MHAFTSSLYHCVWSTKDRRPVLTPEIQARLWPYLGGTARANKTWALAVGGVADHVHILLSLPSTLTISKAIQLLKGNSSKWLHEEFRDLRSFNWQEGYGAFTIGMSSVADTKNYIATQNEHHQKKTFQEKFRSFLDKHGLSYDAATLWD
ncbi:MAG TPA: IS200/IS605 family transposase [Verrucomicrobiae bacterium]|jgi:REP element-mobilizing transposase RayT|nr:IS200/IS605 family transposase [Verrucomicrobiae bacterium]